MIKSKFARLLDTVLFALGFFIVIFAWFNKYIKNFLISCLIALVISFVITKIIWNISNKKINKNNLKTQELKFAQTCIDFFALHPTETLNFFQKLIEDSTLHGEYLYCENSVHFFDYSSDQTNVQTLSKILSKLNTTHTKAYLYSSKLSDKCAKLISQTSIVWVQDYDCFLLMKEKNIFPIDKQTSQNLQKNKFKQHFWQSFARKKAKPYFFYGVLLLLSSFIMPYSLLYCVFGTISIVLALICIVARNNKQINSLS